MKWEYKSFNQKLTDSDLNRLGEEGWELIVHTAVVNDSAFGQYYIFKRQKS